VPILLPYTFEDITAVAMSSTPTQPGQTEREEMGSKGKETPGQEPGQSNGYHQDASLTEEAEEQEKKPSIIQRTWTKLGLDVPTILMMGKAALPPTIALAMYEATSVANTYTTLGYLVAIISILGFCIMPRAKFIQTMTMNILGTCIGSAMAMLMVWSGVKAREHTTDPRAPPQAYNSSQSAVLGVWLWFQIYVVNAMKAKFPQLAFPAIIYAIQVNVAATNGFLFRTTAQCEAFILRLLEAFLSGLGLATGVSLLIIPVTSRKVVLKEVTGYVGLLRGALTAHKTYIHSLENTDMFGQTYIPHSDHDTEEEDEVEDAKRKTKPEIEGIKKMIGSIQGLHGKLTADLPFAKREIAYGKLTADDFEMIFKHLRSIMMPVLGLGSVMDLFERGAEINHWGDNDEQPEHEEERRKAVNEVSVHCTKCL
jgi:hypothetical protein